MSNVSIYILHLIWISVSVKLQSRLRAVFEQTGQTGCFHAFEAGHFLVMVIDYFEHSGTFPKKYICLSQILVCHLGRGYSLRELCHTEPPQDQTTFAY